MVLLLGQFWSYAPRLAPSSSGPGRQVLILKIRGSTPLGVTNKLQQMTKEPRF
jgi:hypothetical protein